MLLITLLHSRQWFYFAIVFVANSKSIGENETDFLFWGEGLNKQLHKRNYANAR